MKKKIKVSSNPYYRRAPQDELEAELKHGCVVIRQKNGITGAVDVIITDLTELLAIYESLSTEVK